MVNTVFRHKFPIMKQFAMSNNIYFCEKKVDFQKLPPRPHTLYFANYCTFPPCIQVFQNVKQFFIWRRIRRKKKLFEYVGGKLIFGGTLFRGSEGLFISDIHIPAATAIRNSDPHTFWNKIVHLLIINFIFGVKTHCFQEIFKEIPESKIRLHSPFAQRLHHCLV